MKTIHWGLLLPALLGCGSVEPAAKPAPVYSTFTIQRHQQSVNLFMGMAPFSFDSFAFDGKTKSVSLTGQSPESDPAPGREYGQYFVSFFDEQDPNDSGKPCDPAMVASRTVALNANHFPYDTVRLRSVRVDTAREWIPDGPVSVCYAIHTPSGWKWDLTPRTFVKDREEPAPPPMTTKDYFGHIDFPIGDEVTDQIAFTGEIPFGGGIIKLTYEAAPE